MNVEEHGTAMLRIKSMIKIMKIITSS